MVTTMMELSHSLILNEDALKEIPEAKKPVFIFEWLRFLDKVLSAAQKSDIKGCQKKLVSQLMEVIQEGGGPPTRQLVSRCLATLFSVGDTFLLFETVNKCNDILRNKDDSPAFLQTKLGAICCIGHMYQKLGRMMGRSYEETVQIMVKTLRNAESLLRVEVMLAFQKICCGMGAAISNCHKDIYKAAKQCLTDRVMAVRCAAASCLLMMMKQAPFLYQSELETLSGCCLRGLEGAEYEARYSIAKLLGALVAATQMQTFIRSPDSGWVWAKSSKDVSLEEALGILMSGFMRGGHSFLKGTGEMIKGTTVNREVRVGVTHAYVLAVQTLGAEWLEQKMSMVVQYVLDLVANPKAAASHVDAVYARNCVSFVLRAVFGRMLGEKAQVAAARHLALLVASQMSSIDFSPENAKDSNQETLFGQHLLVCALQEMGLLVLSLGTTARNLISDQSVNLIDAVFSVLVHPCQAARLAAAYCLRCICIAVPSQCTLLINRCLEGMENMKNTSEAISGYSGALAAIVGSVKFSPLGIPHTKGKVIFNVAEELLRSANQNSRLSLHRTQAGWLVIGAVMTLGSSVVRSLLPRMVLLWRNSFPRSSKELESEKARGDAFTWQVTLEGRAGALSSMHSFLTNCPELVNNDIIRRLLAPVESAISMLINMGSVLKSYGQHLKAPAATVRHRLYETLALIPAHAYEGYYTQILRLLVSEFTLSENPANTSCSLLRSASLGRAVLFGTSPLRIADHRIIEDQLITCSAAGSGALEHDPCYLYRYPSSWNESSSMEVEMEMGGALPLGVAVLDSSVWLFGILYPRIANKHRLQIFDHFAECMRNAKSSRADALAVNLFAALYFALKALTDTKTTIVHEDVRKAATTFILSQLTSANGMVRWAAAECAGRLASVAGEARFTAEVAQRSFDRLKSARDVATRTGHSFALGSVHRYVGGMGSAQHLNTSVSILLALAQDSTSPQVQVWSLEALSAIAESGGPMFRGYVDPSLALALKLLLTVPASHIHVHVAVGKVLSALITVIGPELQSKAGAMCAARSSFLCACSMMEQHDDALVRAEALGCLQQLHLFTPRHLNLETYVSLLCKSLSSEHLLLRKAAVSCLRQLAQREAAELCEHAVAFASEDDNNYLVSESRGLPGALFRLLDTETDKEMRKHIHDTLTSMLQVLAADNLTQWLSLCRSILTTAAEDGGNSASISEETGEEGDEFASVVGVEGGALGKRGLEPRWPSRVFAVVCVQRIIAACLDSHPAHFDLQMAKRIRLTENKGDYLVVHLSELIRMAFIAATSDSDQLRLEGLHTLHIIIDKFAKVPEPEFPGHLLLEQFQAQVGAALRPAFTVDTASNVTSAACAVCSAWIGSHPHHLNHLRRVHQLLVSSLATKLGPASDADAFYNESVATLEKLSILDAWAQIYIVAMTNEGYVKIGSNTDGQKRLSNQSIPEWDDDGKETKDNDDEFGEFESKGESLLSLVKPQLSTLAEHWLAALRDHALLLLPPEYCSQLPRDGGAFYTTETMESCRPHYAATWSSFLYAATLWLSSDLYANLSNHKQLDKKVTQHFGLIFGICMECLCKPQPVPKHILSCLKSLYVLLDLPVPRHILTSNHLLPVELANVLHRLILTNDSLEVHNLSMDVLKQTIKAYQEYLEYLKKNKLEEWNVEGEPSPEVCEELDSLGEGGEFGEVGGLALAGLEVCLCLLARHLPPLNPTPLTSARVSLARVKGQTDHLVAAALDVIQSLPDLCSPSGAVSILPTVLYLTTNAMKEIAISGGRREAEESSVYEDIVDNEAVSASLKTLRSLVAHRYATYASSGEQWKSLLQSTMAKFIDFAKTGSEEKTMDEICLMLALSVFVLHAPSDVVLVPNLQYPCINYFRQCFQSEDKQVRIRCVRTLRVLFKHREKGVATGYIVPLAPRLIEHLHSLTAPQAKLTSGTCRSPVVGNELQLQLVIETIAALETLISLAEPDKGVKVLGMLVPAIVHLLPDYENGQQELQPRNRFENTLDEFCLQWLTKIGPQYPAEFKCVMNESEEIRKKLEAALRRRSSNGSGSKRNAVIVDKESFTWSTAGTSTTTVTPPPPLASKQPTIKLKTDFKNFLNSATTSS